MQDQRNLNASSTGCPRCGYALAGEMLTWQSCCPTRGRCAECGLEFGWADLLNTDRAAPPWSIERNRSAVRPRRAWMNALLRSLLWPIVRPRFACRSLRMEHPISFRRLVCLPIAVVMLALLLAHPTIGARVGVEVAHELRFVRGNPSASPTLWTALAGSRAAAIPWWPRPRASPWPPYDPAQTPARWPGGWQFGTLVITSADPAPRWWATIRRIASTIGFFWSCTLVVALVVAALPQTRRIYRVRTEHIVRIAFYASSFAIIPAAFTVLLELIVSPGYSRTTLRLASLLPWASLVWPLVYFGTVVLHAVWWSRALTHYLRVPHGPAIAVAASLVAVTSLALVVTAIVICGQSFATDMLSPPSVSEPPFIRGLLE